VVDLCVTPDKKTLVTADKTGEIKIWDLAKRTATHTLAAHKKPVYGFAMSPDGKRFASIGSENVVKLWDIAAGKELRTWDFKVPFQQNKPYVRGIAYTPDGKYVASANGDSTVFLLECP